MYIAGLPTVPLGSAQDKIRLAVWYRSEQEKILHAVLGVYTSLVSVNPEIINKVKTMVDDYIEVVVPGSKKMKQESDRNMINTQGKALEAIFQHLENQSKNGKGNPLFKK